MLIVDMESFLLSSSSTRYLHLSVCTVCMLYSACVHVELSLQKYYNNSYIDEITQFLSPEHLWYY